MRTQHTTFTIQALESGEVDLVLPDLLANWYLRLAQLPEDRKYLTHKDLFLIAYNLESFLVEHTTDKYFHRHIQALARFNRMYGVALSFGYSVEVIRK